MAATSSRVFFFAGSRFLISLMFHAIVTVPATTAGGDFKSDQLKYQRVRTAQKEKAALVADLFAAKKVKYPPGKIYIRIFKREKLLELWAADTPEQALTSVRSDRICQL